MNKKYCSMTGKENNECSICSAGQERRRREADSSSTKLLFMNYLYLWGESECEASGGQESRFLVGW